MWKAQLITKTREQDRLKVTVRFFDDSDETGTSFAQDFLASADVGTLSWVKKQVQLKLQALTTLDQTIRSLPIGAVAEPDQIVPPVEVPPTAEGVAQKAYLKKLMTYRQMLKGIELGIFTGNETQIVNQKQWLVDNFQNGFIDLL